MPFSINSESIVPVPEDFEPFSIDNVERSAQELLQESYERHADRIALEADGRQISYRELDRLTNQLANEIIKQIGDKEEPVAVLVEQGLSQLIAVLGILKSGKIYSAFDLANPPERLANMISDFGARLVVSNSNNFDLVRKVVDSSLAVIEMDKLKSGDGKILVPRSADHPVGVYYTSGSTGQSKAVAYTHRSLLHIALTLINRYSVDKDDKLVLPFSCSFAYSISSVFPVLLRGATLYQVNLRDMSMQALAVLIEEKQITVLQLSASLLRSLMGVLDPGRRHFPHLKLQSVGSDAVHVQDIRLWQTLFSCQTVLGCQFAMSEASLLTQNSVRCDTDIPSDMVYLGLPLRDKEIIIVDEERRPLPQGEVGGIAVRSKYLPYGYWNKPEMTKAVYQEDVDDPSKRIFYSNDLGRILPNGQLVHLGRKDNLIKIRAQRVDLAEVEQAIYDLHSVKQVVVVALPARHDPAQTQLAAYIIVKPSVSRDRSAFRKALESKLPAHMIPSFFMFLDEMPLNINGKVDKKSLPPVDFERELREEDQPADDIERRLLDIWRETLKVKQISVTDSFFDLGGDSLLAVRLMLSIEEAFSRRLPVAIISRASNIRQQAELLRGHSGVVSKSVIIPIKTDGDRKPLFCISGRGGNPIRFHRLIYYVSNDRPVYFIRSRGFETDEQLKTTVEEIALDYLVEIKKIQPAGPYYFLGESSGGLIAYELAQQLLRQGEQTALVGMLDTYLDEMKQRNTLNLPNLFMLGKKHVQTLQSGGIDGLRVYFAYYRDLWRFKMNESNETRELKKIHSRYGEASTIYDRVEKANTAASVAYRPKSYDGQVVMFSSSRQPGFINSESDHGWRKVGVKELIVHSIDCYHGNILFEPFVKEVAGILNQYLEIGESK